MNVDVVAPPEPSRTRRRARGRRGSATGAVVLLALVALMCLVSLVVGSRTIGFGHALDLLFHPDGSTESTIVHQLRLPRTALAVAVGASLGIAGALMQGHTRNPLADPGLLGVTSGASFAVVLGIFAFGVASPLGYTWFALAGAGLATAVVFAIGSTGSGGRGGPDPVSLVLAGAAVSALLAALTQGLVLNDQSTLDEYRFWVVGSVAGPGLDVLARVAPFLAVGLVLAAVNSRSLNLLQLGDDVARSLGLSPQRHRVVGLLAIMLLAGGATAACGPVGFVGLVVPHVARALCGVDYRWLLPYAGLVGAIVVLAADVIGRVVVRPAELQVGIVMALVGGPLFVVLVRRVRLVAL